MLAAAVVIAGVGPTPRHLLPLITSRLLTTYYLLTDYLQVDDAYPAAGDSFTLGERGTVLDGFCLLPPFCRSAC